MTPFRRLSLLLAGSLSVLFSLAAQAATTELRVLFDVDHNSATGCVVSGMAGVDQVLVTRVTDDGITAGVTQTHRQLCVSGRLGETVDANSSGWAAGFDAASGRLIVETRVPFTAFGSGMPPSMRVALTGARGAASFAALSQDGEPILFPRGPAGRRRAVANPGPARVITLDGQELDWAGMPAIAQESGASAIQLVQAFAFANPDDFFLYFKFNILLSANGAPTVVPETFVIDENSPNGTAVGTVTAVDDATGHTHTFAILGGNSGDAFAIDAGTGEITVADSSALDYETSSQYVLMVVAADSGAPELSGAGDITIDLSDVGEVPVAAADTNTIAEDGSANVGAPGVLANDVDQDVPHMLKAVLDSGPGHAASFALNANGSYSYQPEANFNGSDSFTYHANDGSADSNVVTVTLTITALNDAPSFTAGANQTVDEDAVAQTVVGWATGMSSGPANESAQNVTFPVDSNTNPALFSGGGQPSVSPNGTLTYTPAANANGSATITLRAVDDGPLLGANASAAHPLTITVNSVNDPPTISVPLDLAYTEGMFPIPHLDETLTVEDVDDADLTSATVQITGNYAIAEDALTFTDAFGITGSFQPSSGTLTLTGPASPANFQAALRTVGYYDFQTFVSTEMRTVTWTVNDSSSSGTDTSTITVAENNSPPSVGAGGTLNYTENDPPTSVDPSVQTSDFDSAGYVGAIVQLTTNYAQGQDVLSFVPASGITASFDALSGTLTMTGFSDKGSWITALKNVLYHNTSDTPSTAPRTVTWQTNDGGATNNLSNVATSTINVIAVADADASRR
jgi:VCBS repeat-containing protein